MKLWKKVTAALKDRQSLLVANITRRTPCRNQDLEIAIIHATNHDECSVDYRNAHRVYKWIRASPINLKSLVHSLSRRVSRTRSWVVALKSLMLFHGVLCCKVPVVSEIRRLPFDLSCFSDGHSRPSQTWGFNAFVRSYYTFLDQYSWFLSEQLHRHRQNKKLQVCQTESLSLSEELHRIQKFQSLLDILLQIRPMGENMKRTLILEAMDCVMIEIFDIYGRIYDGITRSLLKIHQSAGKTEAVMAMKIVQKATDQGEDLVHYFEFCKKFGVSNAHEIPELIRISEEDMQAMERVINGVKRDQIRKKEEAEEEKAIVLVEKPELRTIITEEWEVFEEEEEFDHYRETKQVDRIGDQNVFLPLIVLDDPVCTNHDTVPDLITF